MTDSKKRTAIIITVVFCCLMMGYVDTVIRPKYPLMSIIKGTLFVIFPLVYAYSSKDYSLMHLFKLKKSGLKTPLLLAFGTFCVILGGYFLLGGFFDLTAITTSLTDKIGVTKDNFIFVATYIALINSLLEEFFFRGFAFAALSKYTSRKFVYLFSSTCFALYHVTIMLGWFSIWVFLITMTALIIGGVMFNYLNEKSQSIYPSWLVHVFANFAINTIGLILFGII